MGLDTHSEYVIVNVFAGDNALRACASVLPYKYIACLVACGENNNNNRTEIGLEIRSREKGRRRTSRRSKKTEWIRNRKNGIRGEIGVKIERKG